MHAQIYIDRISYHQAGKDFIEVEVHVLLPAKMNSVVVPVPLGSDNIFPGDDKVFEVYLGAATGLFVSPIAYANVTIIDPDLPLPGKY